MKSPRLKSIVLEDGTIIHDVIGADSGNEDEDNVDDEDEDEDLDENEDEDEDEDEEDDVDSLRARIEELEAANRKAVRRMKAADRAKIDAVNKLAAKNKKPKGQEDEDEDDRDAVIADLRAQLAAAGGSDKASIVREEFRDLTGYSWHDHKLAFSLLDLNEVDVEDGVVDEDSLADAVKALVKAKPFLLKRSDDEEDGEDEDDASVKRQKSGHHSRRRKSKTPDRTAMAKKYPAIATRGK